MNESAEQVRQALSQFLPLLKALTEEEVAAQRGQKWSRKEILGHLIDSAANNHQRFVRAQMTDRLVLPGYEQDVWVTLQQYKSRAWQDLLALWEQYNRHLAHVMDVIPHGRLGTPCVIGNQEAVTLEFIMNDYVRHLRHHLDQILAA